MSQNKLFLPVLLLVLIAASAVAWMAFGSAGERAPAANTVEQAAETEAPEATPEVEAPAALEEATPMAATTPVPAGEREAVAAVEEDDPQEWLDEAVWIEGRAAQDPRTPQDERLLVFAIEEEDEADDLYEGGDPGDRAFLDPPKLGSGLLSVAEVEADGSFRLPVPPDAGVVHLALAGRYQYSQLTTPVAVPPLDPPVLNAELGAWVTGVLHRPAKGGSGSLEGIELELGMDLSGGFNAFGVGRSAWEHEDEADAAGRFEFRAVNPTLKRGIAVRPEGYAGKVELGLELEPGEHRTLEITLARGATVRGRVVDEDGAPLSEVEVSATAPGIMGRVLGELRETETDEEGLFELQNVATGRVAIHAEHDGYVADEEKLTQELADDDVYENVELVLGRGRTVTGRVTFPDGTPAVDAMVRAAPDLASAGQMDGMALQTATRTTGTTDEEGRFSISGLPEQLAYEFTASIEVEEGEREGRWKATHGKVRDGGPLELVLQGLTVVRGRVLDPNGDPVTAFEVSPKKQAKGQAGMFAGFDRFWRSIEDEEGRFEVEGLEPATYDVTVRAEGFASAIHEGVVLPQAEGEELSFTLAPAAVVTGRVLDIGGNPTGGALVSLEVDLGTRMSTRMGADLPSTLSEHDGSFRLELDPGQHSLVASLEGFAASEAVSLDARSGELIEDLELRLRLGGVLTGEVLGNDGEPSAGRMIIVQRLPDYGAQHMLTSDTDGAFRREHLEPGDWQVIATANMLEGEIEGEGEEAMSNFLSEMKMAVATIQEGEETFVTLGAPPKDPVTVSGRVLHAGQGVAGGILSAVPEDAEGISGMKMQAVKEDGSFELELPGPGTYLFTYQTNNGMGQQQNTELMQTIPEGKREHRMDMELPGGRISGRVVDSDGDPLPECRVTVNAEFASYGSLMGGHYVEALTDKDGQYDVLYLSEGSYSVGAGGLAFGGLLGGEAQSGRVVRNGLKLSEGEWMERIDFQLDDPCALTGTVRGADGKPVGNAMVFLRDEAGVLIENFSLVTTDGSGGFRYDGLAPGRYSASARAEGLVSPESGLIRVAPDAPGRVDLPLADGCMLLVSVIDKNGDELGTSLSVVDGNGRQYGTMLSLGEVMQRLGQGFSSKVHRIGPVPAGTYRLVATTDDGRDGGKSVSIAPGQAERKVKLRVR